MKKDNTGTYNSAVPRYIKAFELLDNKCVVLLHHPTAVVHSLNSDKKYYVDYVKGVCNCEDYIYRHESKEGFKCGHILGAQIKAGVVKVNA